MPVNDEGFQMRAWTTEMRFECGDMRATAYRDKHRGSLAQWTIDFCLDDRKIKARCSGDESPADIVASVFAEIAPLSEALDTAFQPVIKAREHYYATLEQIKERFA